MGFNSGFKGLMIRDTIFGRMKPNCPGRFQYILWQRSSLPAGPFSAFVNCSSLNWLKTFGTTTAWILSYDLTLRKNSLCPSSGSDFELAPMVRADLIFLVPIKVDCELTRFGGGGGGVWRDTTSVPFVCIPHDYRTLNTIVAQPTNCPLGINNSIELNIYRVSIKSFPDYKHLLQENYVEYKHNFFYHYLS